MKQPRDLRHSGLEELEREVLPGRIDYSDLESLAIKKYAAGDPASTYSLNVSAWFQAVVEWLWLNGMTVTERTDDDYTAEKAREEGASTVVRFKGR